MNHSSTAMKAAGGSLAIASLILAASLAFHGPPHPDIAIQMHHVAESPAQWAVVHWGAALSLSLFAIVGIVMLTAGSRLTQSVPTIIAWAVLLVGALWTKVTAVAEATVLASAAATGDQATFNTWWVFSEGMANGFACLALAGAIIAGNEALSARRASPAWAAWIGAVAGTTAFIGWAMFSWIGITTGGPIWVISSLVLCLWFAWFGAALALTDVDLAELRSTDVKSAVTR
jgi:hypothetical protein